MHWSLDAVGAESALHFLLQVKINDEEKLANLVTLMSFDEQIVSCQDLEVLCDTVNQAQRG